MREGPTNHDWPAVLAALLDFLAHEPEAKGFHAALEDVIAGLPDAAYE